MKLALYAGALASACLLAMPADAGAQVTRTAWEKYGPVRVTLPARAERHGAPDTFRHAPPVPDPGSSWTELTNLYPGPENPVDIHYLGPNGDYGSGLRTCLTEADFTYFQTFVSIPAGAGLDESKVRLGPVDDGARVLIINSRHPLGFAPEAGYAEIGQDAELDLRPHLVPGETNRIVVQHLDDCAGQAWLHAVQLTLTGASLQRSSSWGGLKERYR
jgi:hypothetical protein